MRDNWSDAELEHIIGAYFGMLEKEIRNEKYSKTEVRNSLLPALPKRTEGAIEFKYKDITAVLMRLGYPYVNGYKAAWNFQHALLKKIVNHVERHPRMYDLFGLFAERDGEPSGDRNFAEVLESTPVRTLDFDEGPMLTPTLTSRVNYLELEQSNRGIVKQGEAFVFEYEKWRLRSLGKESLADQVEWFSVTQGDGSPFDILSKDNNGSDRYIQVKTTKLGKETPIFFTKNERDFSRHHKKNYYLYRVFNFVTSPRMFIAHGSFDDICNVKPWTFRGYFQSN